MGEIEVRRRRGWVGVFVRWRVYVNDDEVGRLWPGSSLRVPAEAGDHTVLVRGVGPEVSNLLTVAVDTERVWLECSYNNGFAVDQIVATPTMTPAARVRRAKAAFGPDPIETLILRRVPTDPK